MLTLNIGLISYVLTDTCICTFCLPLKDTLVLNAKISTVLTLL